jgi:hypothetical protein
MAEKEELEKRIEQSKFDLETYLRIFPLLGVSEKEKDRVVNQMLDDLSKHLKELEKMK